MKTEEQIKQNAEEYCDENFSPLDVDRRQYAEEDFIEGAHSRDEEIKELKEEIESLQEQYNTCFDGFKKRGTKLGELMKENVKLRNPWISVEERLPRDEDYDDENIYCFLVRQECGFIYNCAFDGEEWLTTAPDGEEWGVGGVTHWMPKPELKKGE